VELLKLVKTSRPGTPSLVKPAAMEEEGAVPVQNPEQHEKSVPDVFAKLGEDYTKSSTQPD
jgi:hypothetical protein